MFDQFLVLEAIQLFPILFRRHPDDLGKGAEKIGIIIETALIRDCVERISTQHQLARECHSAVQDIVIDAAVGKACEFMGQIGFADAEAPGKIADSERLGIVIVDISQHILNHAV